MKQIVLTATLLALTLITMAQENKQVQTKPATGPSGITAPPQKYVTLPEGVYNILLQYGYAFKELIPYSPNYDDAQKPGVEKNVLETLNAIQKNFKADTLKEGKK